MEASGTIGQLTIAFLQAYQLPAVFLGAFVFGETVILAAAFLMGQGLFDPSTTLLMAFAGTLAADTLWFVAGRRFFGVLTRWDWFARRYGQVARRLDRLLGRRSLLLFIVIKFLYGTRVIMIVHLAAQRFPLGRFVMFDAIATALWLAVIVPIGWLAGRGALNAGTALGNLRASVIVIVGLLVAYKLFTLWLNRTIVDETDPA